MCEFCKFFDKMKIEPSKMGICQVHNCPIKFRTIIKVVPNMSSPLFFSSSSVKRGVAAASRNCINRQHNYGAQTFSYKLKLKYSNTQTPVDRELITKDFIGQLFAVQRNPHANSTTAADETLISRNYPSLCLVEVKGSRQLGKRTLSELRNLSAECILK